MYHGKEVFAVISAGGSGTRMGAAVPKQFLKIGGETILEKAAGAFFDAPAVDHVVIVTHPDWMPETEALFAKPLAVARRGEKTLDLVPGGAARQDSVRAALDRIREMGVSEEDLILVHDGARPFVSERLIGETLAAAEEQGAAIAAVAPHDTIRLREGGTLDRSKLLAVQTPQTFRAGILMEAHRRAFEEGFLGTDDAGLAERIGCRVAVVEGEDRNIKITTPEDLKVDYRIGTGFDVHRLVEGRKLILGGVTIPYEKGLDGHSDADVLLHALMDAMLGAAALGDIGKLFPDTDDAYLGIDSMVLLGRTWEAVQQAGFGFVNCDVTVICQRPKLRPYIDEMRENIAGALGVTADRVSVKATTTEKLGFTGRGEGIACEAVCLLSTTA